MWDSWDLFGIYMGFMHGIYLGFIWDSCMGFIWDLCGIHGIYLEFMWDSWDLFGIHLEFIRNVYEIFSMIYPSLKGNVENVCRAVDVDGNSLLPSCISFKQIISWEPYTPLLTL